MRCHVWCRLWCYGAYPSWTEHPCFVDISGGQAAGVFGARRVGCCVHAGLGLVERPFSCVEARLDAFSLGCCPVGVDAAVAGTAAYLARRLCAKGVAKRAFSYEKSYGQFGNGVDRLDRISMGAIALRLTIFSAFSRGHDQQFRRRCGRDGTFCCGKRCFLDGRAVAVVASARSGHRPMGDTHCRIGVACEFGVGAVDGSGGKHRALVRRSVADS